MSVRNEIPDLARVTIYLDGDGWMCDHADDPQAAEVRQLFDTTVLPLPFLRSASEAAVRDALTRKNPGIVITRGADRVTHLTLTGPAAGTPFCGCDKAAQLALGDRFAHVPYTNGDAFLARPEICPACKAEWDAAGEGE